MNTGRQAPLPLPEKRAGLAARPRSNRSDLNPAHARVFIDAHYGHFVFSLFLT